MTSDAHSIRPTDRGALWWASVILAPIGLFVQWRGPIGYLVLFVINALWA